MHFGGILHISQKGYRVQTKRKDTTVPSQQELDLLFGPLYDEFFNDGTSRVNKSSSPTDNSIQKDTLPSTHIQPTSEPTTPTNVDAEENNDNQAEFTNPLCTPVQEIAESSSRNIEAMLRKKSISCLITSLGTSLTKPFGKKVIKLKWLWKNKKDEDQTVIRTKARIVAIWLCSGRGTLLLKNHLLQLLRLEVSVILCRYAAHKSFPHLSDGRENAFSNGQLKEGGLQIQQSHAVANDTRRSNFGGIQFLGDKLVRAGFVREARFTSPYQSTSISATLTPKKKVSVSRQIELGMRCLTYSRMEIFKVVKLQRKGLCTHLDISSKKVLWLRSHTLQTSYLTDDSEVIQVGRMPTKIELTLEQSQQGVSNDVLVSIEGVEELKRNVWIKGEKKEALHTT
ncbi:hypothetical protein Tco_0968319 [Tanacetum coccineum]